MTPHHRPFRGRFRQGSAKGLLVLAIAFVVLGVGTCTAGLFEKKCKQRPKRCPNECIEVPYALPNHGYSATRWRRWSESPDGACAQTVPTHPVPGPAPGVEYDPQFPPNTRPSTPSWNSPSPLPYSESPEPSFPQWRDAPGRLAPVERSPHHLEPPAPKPAESLPRPRPAPGESQTQFETREWRLDGAGRGSVVPRYSGIDTGTRRLSFEREVEPSRGLPIAADDDTLELPTVAVQYPTREWRPERRHAATERPVDAVLVNRPVRPASAPPTPVRTPRSTGRPVGRPGPTGYYRLVSKPLGPQPPRTPSDRIVR